MDELEDLYNGGDMGQRENDTRVLRTPRPERDPLISDSNLLSSMIHLLTILF